MIREIFINFTCRNIEGFLIIEFLNILGQHNLYDR